MDEGRIRSGCRKFVSCDRSHVQIAPERFKRSPTQRGSGCHSSRTRASYNKHATAIGRSKTSTRCKGLLFRFPPRSRPQSLTETCCASVFGRRLCQEIFSLSSSEEQSYRWSYAKNSFPEWRRASTTHGNAGGVGRGNMYCSLLYL